MRHKWQLLAVLCLLAATCGRLNAQALKTTLAPKAPVSTTLAAPVHPRPGALTSIAKLDLLLVKASAPNATQTDVEQAVNGIFKDTGADPNMLGISSVRNQIVSAELAYHNQHHSPITEDRVVSAVNNLSTTWGLPSYTHTSASEVHKLHMALVFAFPQFLTTDPNTRASVKPQNGKKTLVRAEMSPLETTLMFSTLVQQKLSNPEYQMTPEEFSTVTATRKTDAPEPKLQNRTAELNATLRSKGIISRLPDLLTQADKTISDLSISGGAR